MGKKRKGNSGDPRKQAAIPMEDPTVDDMRDLRAEQVGGPPPKHFSPEQIDETFMRLSSVIHRQRDAIDRLVTERQELLGHRLVTSVIFDRQEVEKGVPYANGDLLLKMTAEELTQTDPARYEMSIEEHMAEGGERFFCIRAVTDTDPEPEGE